MYVRRSWDPLYGRIDFSEFENNLLLLPEIQRLRYVRMCNINSMLVTGASEISRFEHIIGVMHLAKEWAKLQKLPESEARDLVAAAALHDMQTGPFGHSMQYVLEDNLGEEEFLHDDIKHGWRSTYHQQMLAGAAFAGKTFSASRFLGSRWENVTSIIHGDGLYGPLIAGTMDLDNIDNVVRLAFHVGIVDQSEKKLPLELLKNICIKDGRLALPSASASLIERWQVIRTNLYRLLLLDWAEFSAKAMLTKAIELAARYKIIGADSWIKTDLEFLDFIQSQSIGAPQEIKELILRLRRGELYHPITMLSSTSISKYQELSTTEAKSRIEKKILTSGKSKTSKILLHLILDKGKTERSVTFISIEESKEMVVGQDSRQLLIGLFSQSLLSEAEHRDIIKTSLDIFQSEGLENLIELDDPMGTAPMSQTSLL